MNIWVDIDETIAATFREIIPHIEKCCNVKKFEWDDCIEHDMWNIPKLGITKEQTIVIWDAWWEEKWHLVPPIEWSVEKLHLLKNLGHRLFAITARNEWKRRDLTENWVENFFPNIFEDLRFTGHTTANPKMKSDSCKELGVSLMIEDNIDYALELANNGVTTILLEKPWNKHRSEKHAKIIRVKNWDTIPEIIFDYAKKS